jgi:hypothetical protein
VRVYYFGLDAFSIKKVNSFIPIGTSGFLQKAENSDVLYELKPHIDSYFKLKEFKTNAFGNRDKEYKLTKPENTIRGLVLGDSYTMGSGVEIEDVYHSVVEQRLNEQANGINHELINMGVGGYNLLNYKGILKNKALSFNPDYIIIGYCGFNDYFLPALKHYDGDYKVKIKKREKDPFYAFYLGGLIEKSFAKTNTKQLWGMTTEQKVFVNIKFSEFKQFSDSTGIPIVICVVSVLEDNGNLAILRSIAEKHNLPITDTYDKINPKELREYTISKLDHHPNKKANKIYADNLLSFDPFKEIISKKKFEISK